MTENYRKRGKPNCVHAAWPSRALPQLLKIQTLVTREDDPAVAVAVQPCEYLQEAIRLLSFPAELPEFRSWSVI